MWLLVWGLSHGIFVLLFRSLGRGTICLNKALKVYLFAMKRAFFLWFLLPFGVVGAVYKAKKDRRPLYRVVHGAKTFYLYGILDFVPKRGYRVPKLVREKLAQKHVQLVFNRCYMDRDFMQKQRACLYFLRFLVKKMGGKKGIGMLKKLLLFVEELTPKELTFFPFEQLPIVGILLGKSHSVCFPAYMLTQCSVHPPKGLRKWYGEDFATKKLLALGVKGVNAIVYANINEIIDLRLLLYIDQASAVEVNELFRQKMNELNAYRTFNEALFQVKRGDQREVYTLFKLILRMVVHEDEKTLFFVLPIRYFGGRYGLCQLLRDRGYGVKLL